MSKQVDKTAKALSDKLVDAFSRQKEVARIRIFGKLAEGTFDQYSDVDIRIVSKDPFLTQSYYRKLIEESVSSIIKSTFLLVSDVNVYAEMIMLKDYTPYQKIDFDIEREGYGIDFKPSKDIYIAQNAVGEDQNLKIYPIANSVGYSLQNILFSVPRMTKCFFRKDFDMYRRWKSMTDVLLVLLYEKYFGYSEITDKKELKANEAKNLFLKLTDEDRNYLNRILPTEGKLTIPTSYLDALRLFVQESQRKASSFSVQLDTNFINYMFNFAEEEIRRVLYA